MPLPSTETHGAPNIPASSSSRLQSVQQDDAESDTHNFIGLHNEEESSPRSYRCRPGFNVHRPMLEEEESSVSLDSPSSTTCFIDNSVLLYIPMRLKCGVTVFCRPDVLARCPAILRDLNNDVRACLGVLPPSVHSLVKRTNIYVNTTYYYGPREKPRNVNHSTAHHHEGWLFWARDKPEKAGGIEIYNCFDYRVMRLHWNGCGLLLHEMCHLIHQFTLPNGLENEFVMDAFQKAQKSGLYEHTIRRDWAGLDRDDDMAYCLVNHKEFFAELSVAYLSKGYKDLDQADKTSMEQCSPPLMAPGVVERVNQQKKSAVVPVSAPEAKWWNPFKRFLQLFKKKKPIVPHCNKFYPFTGGQFRAHDPALFAVFEELWKQIEVWQDENDERPCFRLRKCWPF